MLTLTPSAQAAPFSAFSNQGRPHPLVFSVPLPVPLSTFTVFSRARNWTLLVNKTLFFGQKTRGAAPLPSDHVINLS